MLTSCKYCGGLHKRGYICPNKPVRQKESNSINRFRWTRQWGNKREQIRKRDNYLCQVCKQDSKYTYTNLEVHHIVPLVEDYSLRLDDNNLITLCTDHHKQADDNKLEKEYLLSLVRSQDQF